MSALRSSSERRPFGSQGLTLVDKFGVWLSQGAIVKHLPRRGGLEVLELGCGLHAKNLTALQPRLRRGVGVDFIISDDAKQLAGLEFLEGPIDVATVGLAPESLDAILFIPHSPLYYYWRSFWLRIRLSSLACI